jgi:hypothetical protein
MIKNHDNHSHATSFSCYLIIKNNKNNTNRGVFSRFLSFSSRFFMEIPLQSNKSNATTATFSIPYG